MDGETPMYGSAVVHHIHKHDHDHDHDHDHEDVIVGARAGGTGMYGSGLEGMIAGLCANKGIDPGVIALMKDKDHDGMFGGSGMLVLLFLIILMGGRGFGHGGYGHDGGYSGGYGGAGIVNQIDYATLLGAIEKTGLAQTSHIDKLAAELNCDTNAIRTAICGLDKGMAMLDGKLGFIDSDIKCAVKECCCNMRLEVERSTNILSREICATNTNIDAKFCALERRMDEQFCKTDALIVKCDTDNRIRELEEEKRKLEAKVFQDSQARQTAEIIATLKANAAPTNITSPV